MSRSRTHPGLVVPFVVIGLGCVAVIAHRWTDQGRRPRPAEPSDPAAGSDGPQHPVPAPTEPEHRLTLSAPATMIAAVAFTPDGRFVLAGGTGTDRRLRDQPVVRGWNADGTGEMFTLSTDGEVGQGVALAVSPDGRTVALGGQHMVGEKPVGFVTLWDVAGRKAKWTAEVAAKRVACLAWAPDGSALAGGDVGGTVTLWAADGGVKAAWAAHPAGVTSLAWHGDGKVLATAGAPSAKVWDANDRRLVAEISAERNLMSAVAFSGETTVLVAGRWAGDVWEWDFAANREARAFAAQPAPVGGLRLAPGARGLVTAANDGLLSPEPTLTVRGWDAAGRELWSVPVDTDETSPSACPFALAPDGRRLAVASMLRGDRGVAWTVEVFDLPPVP